MAIEKKFATFLKDTLAVSRLTECFREFRTNPDIPLRHIIGTILWMPFLGARSLLGVDRLARTPSVRALFGLTERKMVVSDTTIKRVLKRCSPQWSRTALLRLAAPLERLRMLKRALVHRGTPRRMGLVDGSYLGKQPCVCLTLLGSVRVPVMLEPHSEGKELPVAQRLLRRAPRLLGSRSPQLWLCDALYFTKDTFRLVRAQGAHLVVKASSSEFRDTLRDAAALFAGAGGAVEGIPHAQGIDSERQCSWQIKETSGSFADFPIRVLWLHEHYFKRRSNQSVTTWIVTTDPDLSSAEIREAAHLRWQIENNVFKRMAHHSATKRLWCDDTDVLMTLLRLFCAATAVFDAFTAFILSHTAAERNTILDGIKPTWANIFSQVATFFSFGFVARILVPPG